MLGDQPPSVAGRPPDDDVEFGHALRLLVGADPSGLPLGRSTPPPVQLSGCNVRGANRRCLPARGASCRCAMLGGRTARDARGGRTGGLDDAEACLGLPIKFWGGAWTPFGIRLIPDCARPFSC